MDFLLDTIWPFLMLLCEATVAAGKGNAHLARDDFCKWEIGRKAYFQICGEVLLTYKQKKLEVSLTERACARCWMSVPYTRSHQAFQRFRWAVSPCAPLRWCRQLVCALDSTRRFRFDIICSVLCSCAATWMLPAFVTAPGELTGWKLVISNNSRAQNVGPKTGINYQNSACDFPLYWAHAHVCVPLYLGWLFSWKILQNWLS